MTKVKTDHKDGVTTHVDPKLVMGDVQKHLDSQVTNIEEIKAGSCNRLFRFDLEDKRSVLVKYYYDDERQRLQREFTALSFLINNDFDNVPRAYYDDPARGYAVYSFEAGRPKPAEELTRQELSQMVDFLTKLHSYDSKHVTTDFPNAIFACLSFNDYLKNIEHRCDQFRRAFDANTLSDKVRQFAEDRHIIEQVNEHIERAIQGISREELHRSISLPLRRLSTVDFGSHNTLFRADGSPCFVDFEYFGWDDPLRDIAGFVEHDQSRMLSREDRQFTLDYYRDNVNLPTEALERLPTILHLFSIEWITIHLFALTPTKISLRKFSDPDFDQDTYEQEQLAKISDRLVIEI